MISLKIEAVLGLNDNRDNDGGDKVVSIPSRPAREIGTHSESLRH